MTVSLAYARSHAVVSENPEDDWLVLAADVPASKVRTDGNDLCEQGYVGPRIWDFWVVGLDE